MKSQIPTPEEIKLLYKLARYMGYDLKRVYWEPLPWHYEDDTAESHPGQLSLDDAASDADSTPARKSTDREMYPNGKRPYTESDDYMLIGMYHAGIETKQMAQRLARPPKGIEMRLMRLRQQGRLD